LISIDAFFSSMRIPEGHYDCTYFLYYSVIFHEIITALNEKKTNLGV
jgi:hypothetical protein